MKEYEITTQKQKRRVDFLFRGARVGFQHGPRSDSIYDAALALSKFADWILSLNCCAGTWLRQFAKAMIPKTVDLILFEQ
jgi:hypothetical protein